ncbi:hypothetical protein ACI2S5_14800 [Ralstonia nicotianae]
MLETIKQAMLPAFAKLSDQALPWLAALATAQFFITNWKLLMGDGDLQGAVAKMVAAVAWVGFCLYLIAHAPGWIVAVGDQMFALVGDIPTPASIMKTTFGLVGVLAGLALGVGAVPLVGGTAGNIVILILLVVLGVGMYLALKIFMLQLEAVLIATLSPMSFALLGLNTLRDQGIAPFKSLLSLAYRIVLVGVMMSAFSTMSEALTSALNAITVQQMITDGLGSVLSPVVSIIGAYLLLAFCLFKSDAIASSLAGGTSAIGASDVTSAAAAGAAATGGASAVAGAGKVPQTMSGFMDKLKGGGGSIQDASSMGSGGDAPVFTPPTAPALSVGGDGTASATASGAAPAGVSPSRSQPGNASNPSKFNVASGRYGGPYDAETPEADSQAATTTAGAADSGQPDQKGAASTDKGALPSEAADEARESARGATIGGQHGSPQLEETLGKLIDHLSQPSKPKAGQQLRDLDQRLAHEKATVGVSINPHHD